MKTKKYRKLKRWKYLIKTALCLSVLLPAVFLMESYAAEVPSFFTIESIMQEGIEDRNFAKAIYESIAKEIMRNNYLLDDNWNTKEILLNYGKETPTNESAIINAQTKGINSIVGIKLLKNCHAIRLSANNIHDISPLKRDMSNEEDRLYFNNTQISIDINNFQNIVPAELVGSKSGNISVDSAMVFDEALVNYLYEDQAEKRINLDFDLELDGEKGGCFNKELSDKYSKNEVDAIVSTYADYVNRYTGTKITLHQNDGILLIVANTNEDLANSYRPTIHYWTGDAIDQKLNLQWEYPFRTKFYRTLKEDFTPVIYGGVKLFKRDPDGNPLPGAKYILWRVETDGTRTRYPGENTVFTSDAEGKLIVSDLSEGKYEFVEIEAPEGYAADSDPLEFTVKNITAGHIATAVSGGDAEADITSDDAEYAPVWDSVEEVENGHTVKKHKMKLSKGSVTSVTASGLGADALISNHGAELSYLKGEILDNGSISLIPEESEVLVYAGNSFLGSFADPAEARNVINSAIQTGAFDSTKGNVTVNAKVAYRAAESEYNELVHVNHKKSETEPDPDPDPAPVLDPPAIPIEKVSDVSVIKTWSEESHPSEAFFQLFIKLKDGTLRLIGKAKRVTEEAGWQASWNYREIRSGVDEKASVSNASAATASNASPSDASKTELYDEDGLLLDGMVMDDLGEELYVEEINIPEGWEPLYEEPEYTADGNVLFSVKNRKVPEDPGNSRKEEPEEDPERDPEEEPERDHPTGSPGSSGGDVPENRVPDLPEPAAEPVLPEQQVLGVRRNVIRKKRGLPYGTITSEKMPSMGEETEEEEKHAGVILLCVFLALFLGIEYGNRKKNRGKTGHARG